VTSIGFSANVFLDYIPFSVVVLEFAVSIVVEAGL
jgi:hypothetical protein